MSVTLPGQSTADAIQSLEGPPELPDQMPIPEGHKVVAVPAQVVVPSVFVPQGVQTAWGQDGNLYHAVKMASPTLGGEPEWQWRRLALNLQQAREERLDYYHPALGLIWNGVKLARDRTPQDIMNDSSVGGLPIPGEVPVEKAGYAPDAEPAHS